jgi:hypothetical protein
MSPIGDIALPGLAWPENNPQSFKGFAVAGSERCCYSPMSDT